MSNDFVNFLKSNDKFEIFVVKHYYDDSEYLALVFKDDYAPSDKLSCYYRTHKTVSSDLKSSDDDVLWTGLQKNLVNSMKPNIYKSFTDRILKKAEPQECFDFLERHNIVIRNLKLGDYTSGIVKWNGLYKLVDIQKLNRSTTYVSCRGVETHIHRVTSINGIIHHQKEVIYTFNYPVAIGQITGKIKEQEMNKAAETKEPEKTRKFVRSGGSLFCLDNNDRLLKHCYYEEIPEYLHHYVDCAKISGYKEIPNFTYEDYCKFYGVKPCYEKPLTPNELYEQFLKSCLKDGKYHGVLGCQAEAIELFLRTFYLLMRSTKQMEQDVKNVALNFIYNVIYSERQEMMAKGVSFEKDIDSVSRKYQIRRVANATPTFEEFGKELSNIMTLIVQGKIK